MAETIMTRRAGCKRCPFQCSRVVHVKDGEFATEANIEAPEYETLGAFGSMQDVDSLEGIAKANQECNRLGPSTPSRRAAPSRSPTNAMRRAC